MPDTFDICMWPRSVRSQLLSRLTRGKLTAAAVARILDNAQGKQKHVASETVHADRLCSRRTETVLSMSGVGRHRNRLVNQPYQYWQGLAMVPIIVCVILVISSLQHDSIVCGCVTRYVSQSEYTIRAVSNLTQTQHSSCCVMRRRKGPFPKHHVGKQKGTPLSI